MSVKTTSSGYISWLSNSRMSTDTSYFDPLSKPSADPLSNDTTHHHTGKGKNILGFRSL